MTWEESMALQDSYTDEHGTTHATAYGRIVGVRLRPDMEWARVKLAIFKDATARTDGDKTPVGYRTYIFESTTATTYADLFGVAALDVVNINPLKSAYDHIKTLDEWSTATDV